MDSKVLHRILDVIDRAQDRDTSFGNVLSMSMGGWERYYEFLHRVLDRLEVAGVRYTSAESRFDECMSAHPEGGMLSVADEEAFERMREAGFDLDMEIETFFLFAKILLDRVADTLCWLLGLPGPGSGSSHTYLLRRFTRACAEHPFEARRFATRSRDATGQWRLTANLVYPRDDAEALEYLQKRSAAPAEVSQAIDAYMHAAIDFLHVNLDALLTRRRSSRQ